MRANESYSPPGTAPSSTTTTSLRFVRARFGDLSPAHVFYDEIAQRLCGIIDFGDAAIGDSDYDFMDVLTDYGKPLLLGLLQHYQHPDTRTLFRKLDAFRLFDAVRYLSFGHARGDSVMMCEGLGDLRELLRSRAARVVGS